MTISNAPAADASGNVRGFTKIVNVQGVALAVDPTKGACLSSGFGPRGSGAHEGLDFHSADGGPIMAAADGLVIEKKYRDDYGNMLLIDHGKGVYTRYAHLSSFTAGVDMGSKVKAGQIIGMMGNTASYRIPVHLHYELLLGDYNNPKASFGLTPESPFKFAKL
jgi:murein DD-endopeptidase MepM/ murein hydrolase activator NlpD